MSTCKKHKMSMNALMAWFGKEYLKSISWSR